MTSEGPSHANAASSPQPQAVLVGALRRPGGAVPGAPRPRFLGPVHVPLPCLKPARLWAIGLGGRLLGRGAG